MFLFLTDSEKKHPIANRYIKYQTTADRWINIFDEHCKNNPFLSIVFTDMCKVQKDDKS